jgi:hypothetical protein
MSSNINSAMRNFSLAFFLLVAATTRVVKAQSFGMDAEQLQQGANAMAELQESDILSPSTLMQVHVIARHGARTILSKDANTLAEYGGANLTPMGQKQLYDLGTWLKDQYGPLLGGPTEGGTRSLDYFNPNLHRFESTNVDRTLSSANAVSMGLFPSNKRASGSQNIDPNDPSYLDTVYDNYENMPAIPVYTLGNEVNDIVLRTHKNCPTFLDRLSELYKRPEWKSMEEQNEDLLVKLATLYPAKAVNGKVPLTELWNVYDAIHVAKTECLENPSDSSTFFCSAFLDRESVLAANSLTSDEFSVLETLAEHIEFIKYAGGLDTPTDTGAITAGTLLGSNLLRTILDRSMGDGHFFFYSAHAPTLLGFLATLQASRDFLRDTAGEKFIEYGSALIVEIHKSADKGKYYFVLKYKNSDSADAFHVIMKESTTCVQCGQDDSGLSMIPKASWCLLDEVTTFAKTYAFTSDEAWCRACKNREADVCIRSGNSRGTPTLDAWMVSSESMGYTGSTGATVIICALFFGGFFTGVAIMGLVWCCRERRDVSLNQEKAGLIRPKEDASTKSYISNEGEESPVVIANIDFDDMNDSAEQLNNKEIL